MEVSEEVRNFLELIFLSIPAEKNKNNNQTHAHLTQKKNKRKNKPYEEE